MLTYRSILRILTIKSRDIRYNIPGVVNRGNLTHNRNGGDVQLFQRFQLVRLRDTILVQVLPNHDLGEFFISRVKQTITVTIEISQRFKSISGQLTIFK